MRILVIGLIALGAVAASIPQAQSQSSARPTMANEADFRRAMKELSNWGRWGNARWRENAARQPMTAIGVDVAQGGGLPPRDERTLELGTMGK